MPLGIELPNPAQPISDITNAGFREEIENSILGDDSNIRDNGPLTGVGSRTDEYEAEEENDELADYLHPEEMDFVQSLDRPPELQLTEEEQAEVEQAQAEAEAATAELMERLEGGLPAYDAVIEATGLDSPEYVKAVAREVVAALGEEEAAIDPEILTLHLNRTALDAFATFQRNDGNLGAVGPVPIGAAQVWVKQFMEGLGQDTSAVNFNRINCQGLVSSFYEGTNNILRTYYENGGRVTTSPEMAVKFTSAFFGPMPLARSMAIANFWSDYVVNVIESAHGIGPNDDIFNDPAVMEMIRSEYLGPGENE